MSRWTLLSICCLLCATNGTLADIYVWQGDPNHCTISDVNNTIQINEAGTYGFRAWDPGTEELEAIQWITVNPDVTGTVTVKIAWDATGGDGATDVWQLDLTGGSGTGNLGGLRISGDLATVDDVVCDNITGTVTCGDVDNDVTLDQSLTGSMTVSDVTGTITIVNGRLNGSLTANTLGDVDLQAQSGIAPHQGDIAVTQNYAGTISVRRGFYGDMTFANNVSGNISLSLLAGDITIGGTLSGAITITGNVVGDIAIGIDLEGEIQVGSETGSASSISVTGDVTSTGSIGVGGRAKGVIDIGDDHDGQIDIEGNLNKPGRIVIAGDVGQTDATVAAVHIHGSVEGTAGGSPEDPMVEVAGQLGAVLAIDGSLQNAVNGPEIEVASIDLEGLGAIAIDYDGEPLADEWEDGAQVKVGTETYAGNTPAARLRDHELQGRHEQQRADGPGQRRRSRGAVGRDH